MKFHQKPFEWAYEGLAPLLLRDVLQTRRGIGLSLTMLFAAVASRTGLHLLPYPLSPTGEECFSSMSILSGNDGGKRSSESAEPRVQIASKQRRW